MVGSDVTIIEESQYIRGCQEQSGSKSNQAKSRDTVASLSKQVIRVQDIIPTTLAGFNCNCLYSVRHYFQRIYVYLVLVNQRRQV